MIKINLNNIHKLLNSTCLNQTLFISNCPVSQNCKSCKYYKYREYTHNNYILNRINSELCELYSIFSLEGILL